MAPRKKGKGLSYKWRHELVPDGPIVKDVRSTLFDPLGEKMEDPWRRLEFTGFLDHAQREAERIIREISARPKPSEAQLRDAAATLRRVLTVRRRLPPNSLTDTSPDQWRCIRILAVTCLDLGRSYERMMCRAVEPDVTRGQKTLASAKKGAVSLHGSPTARQEKWAEYQACVDRLRAKHPSQSKSWIMRRAAEECHVSRPTIKRRTKVQPPTPSPRNTRK